MSSLSPPPLFSALTGLRYSYNYHYYASLLPLINDGSSHASYDLTTILWKGGKHQTAAFRDLNASFFQQDFVSCFAQAVRQSSALWFCDHVVDHIETQIFVLCTKYSGEIFLIR